MLSLGWPLPERVVDLFVEFRNTTNGLPKPRGNGLLGALTYFGLDSIESAEKETMRALAMRGGSYDSDERLALLDYCQTDVDALSKLLPMMLPAIDFPRALLRGRYMTAVARMENTGIPIDVDTLASFRRHWDAIKDDLIKYETIDAEEVKQIIAGKPLTKPTVLDLLEAEKKAPPPKPQSKPRESQSDMPGDCLVKRVTEAESDSVRIIIVGGLSRESR